MKGLLETLLPKNVIKAPVTKSTELTEVVEDQTYIDDFPQEASYPQESEIYQLNYSNSEEADSVTEAHEITVDTLMKRIAAEIFLNPEINKQFELAVLNEFMQLVKSASNTHLPRGEIDKKYSIRVQQFIDRIKPFLVEEVRSFRHEFEKAT